MLKIKNVCCIGAGYVGGPTMSVFASKCPDINFHVVDISKEKIKLWNSKNLKNLPVYEPGLEEIITSQRNKNLFFSNDVDEAIIKSEIIFIAVNTPTKTYGYGKNKAADLKYVEICARKIAEIADKDKIVVEKSTIPVKTAEVIKKILDLSLSKCKFEVLSNPEFLAEGSAINDLINPDRVLIGGDNNSYENKAINILENLYLNWVPKDNIIKTNLWSSELSKLAANAFLAQRVSSINSISAICEESGADIDEVSIAIGMDSRIGKNFLKASVGFGGSCFQKDILNLSYIAESLGLYEVSEYWESVVKMNNYQRERFVRKILSTLFNTVSEKKITILGWAFKKDTNDTRESSSIYIAKKLLQEGAHLYIYDPMVENKKVISDLINCGISEEDIKNKVFFENEKNMFSNSHAVLILTEWEEFKSYDWKNIFSLMLKPANIFDGRRILNQKDLINIGFNVHFIGSK
jgi:UDPglucose 6-dehydrogenase